MLGDVVRAYRMPIAGAHQPTFFPFGVQRKPYINERAKRTSCAEGRMDGWMDGWTDGWTDGWMDGRMDGDQKYPSIFLILMYVKDQVYMYLYMFSKVATKILMGFKFLCQVEGHRQKFQNYCR